MISTIKFENLYREPSRNGLSRASFENGKGVKIVNMGELFGFPRLKNPEMRFVIATQREMKKFSLEKGDLLFARRSLVVEGAGKCSIVLDDSEVKLFESSIIRVRLDTTKADPLFYFYYFTSEVGFSTIQTLVNEVAASGIRSSELAKLKVLYIEPSIQKQIASTLCAYDDLIEVNNRRIKLLEETAKQLYKEWFVRMRFPGYKQAKFVKGIPEGWEVKKFTEIISVLSGGTPKTKIAKYWDGNIFWFSPRDIQNSFYILSTEKKITELGLKKCNSKLYPENTIFITARGTVGNCVLTGVPMAMNQTNYALICKEGFELSQFFAYLLLLELVEEFKKGANGAVFDTITISTFERTKIILPDENILKKFNQIISPFFNQMKILLQQNIQLRQIRDRLLPRLVSGKLQVKSVEVQS